MKPRVALWSVLGLSIAAGPLMAQGGRANPAQGCRAVGLFVLDVKSSPLTIVVVPKQLAVTYPKPTETDKEVCFSVVLVNADQGDRFEQLKFKYKSVTGRGGADVFKVKKEHPASANLISLEFVGVPDWDADGDGVLNDVVQPFELEAKFKGQTVLLDPEIIIKKGG